MKKQDFDRITDMVNTAIELARVSGNQWAVNWHDCRSIELLRATNSIGESFWISTVSEASPDAWEFAKFIQDQLKYTGETVRVIIEW